MFILGISGALGHDSAACLLREGTLIAMAEEERFLRVPHASGGVFPLQAIEYCLKQGGITLEEVDYIAISWDTALIPETKYPLLPKYYSDIANLFPKNIFPHRSFPKVEVVDHHLAHAASAYYFSGLDESAILVVDGAGEGTSTTFYQGKEGRINKIQEITHNESLGEFYNQATTYLGFSWTDAGKTMGLAPYGQPLYEFPLIQLDREAGYRMDIDHSMHMKHLDEIWTREFTKLGVTRPETMTKYSPHLFRFTDELQFNQDHKNFAASVQKKLEECYFSLARVATEKTGSRNLCIAGGVAMNCVANGKLSRSGIVDQLFVQPAAYDAGAALGAAAEIAARLGFRVEATDHVYSGPSFTNDEIGKFLEHAGIAYKVKSDVSEAAGELLAEGKTVGWFQGRAEYGARALGNRSMLANPTVPDIWNRMNHQVKYREGFRPFGPSVLSEQVGEWFEDGAASHYMMRSFQVKEEKRSAIQGVVHVDGSSRPQTVSKATNARYHALIEHFYKKTGVPMVLNTSFNLRGEPMVGSPYDAVRTFYASALDALVLNEYVIVK